jgi:hypothetical protein
MTTPPPFKISYDFGANFILLPATLWKYFCPEADANNLFPEVRLLAPDCLVVNGTNNFGAMIIPLDNPENVQIWLYDGLVTKPRGEILEFAGWLTDRKTNSAPFVDEPGGKILKASQITTGLDQLYWAVS